MKRNKSVLQAAVASAVLLMAAGAQAGTIGTTTQNYATEIFGTGSSTIGIEPLGINYQFGVPIAANQTMYVYITLSNGAQFSSATPPVDTTFVCVDAASAHVTASAATVLTASATNVPGAIFTINTGPNGFSTNSVCNFNPTTTVIQGLTSALSASGGSVSATWAQAVSLNTSAVPTTGLIDSAGTHTGVILTSSTAITGSIISSAAFSAANGLGVGETAKISVPAETGFTVPAASLSNADSATVIDLGAYTFTNNASAPLDAAGVPYILSAQGSSVSGTVTGAFVTGSLFTIDTVNNCTTPVAAGSTATSTAAKATFSGVTLAVNKTPYYICYTPTATKQIPVTTPVATFTVNKKAVTDIADTATGNLYPLVLNGVSREVRTYIPAAATGYTSFVRLINSTSTSAPISGYFAYQDGTTSTPAALSFSINGAAASSTLPAGGSVTLTSAQIEASLGAVSAAEGGANARPRLIISAPVSDIVGNGPELTGFGSIEAQSFILTDANGNFSDATGAQ
jgi:hypothetical protein